MNVDAYNDGGRPPGCVQLDLDGLWAVLEHLGHTADPENDPLYRHALPRFLRLFERHGVRATLFVVARDLRIPWKAEILAEAVRAGHEIASHGLTHHPLPDTHGREALRDELERAAAGIEEALGVRPVGFRAPGFRCTSGLHEALESCGFLYDASVLPSPSLPLIRCLQVFLSGSCPRTSGSLQLLRVGCAPQGPYRPAAGRFWKKGDRGLWEFPVSTVPGLRIPFHASYLLAMPGSAPARALLELGLRLLEARGLPPVFLFHLADLAEPLHDPRLRGHPGLDAPLARKQALCERVLQRIGRRFRFVTTRELLLLRSSNRGSDRPA